MKKEEIQFPKSPQVHFFVLSFFSTLIFFLFLGPEMGPTISMIIPK